MIIVTGALGFIGSCMVSKLNESGHRDNLLVVDNFYNHKKEVNLNGKRIREWVHRDIFIDLFQKMGDSIDAVYHLGARTDTTEQDSTIFDQLNIDYSKSIWKICTEFEIPLVYASSAATYGNGENGYDDKKKIDGLQPMNPYGQSKQDFDVWAMKQKKTPPKWVGLKFFNVYGPNEYHKGRMASVIFHAYNQIKKTGKLKLFKSHRKDFKDGQQSRDFVYVKDVVQACEWVMNNELKNGLYNIGTGTARPFEELGKATFKAMGKKINIEYIDTPEDIRDTYQYFTEAKMDKLTKAGYPDSWMNLQEGATDYVKEYLMKGNYY